MSRLLHGNVGTVDPIGPYVPNDFSFPATLDTTPFLRNLVLRIAGTDRSGYARADSMSGTLQLEGRDSLSLELIDTTDTYRPSVSESVEVLSNTNLLFRGQITEIEESYEINEDRKVRHMQLRVAGAGHALDRRLVFSDIPGNSLYSCLIQTLQPNGIHTDIYGFYDFVPFPGPQIEQQRFNGSTALQAVQRMVNAAGDGWTWWLDWTGNFPYLHVRDISTDPIDAPWDATDASDNIHEVVGVDRDDSEYANRVYVRMGSEATSTVTEQFIGGSLAEDIYPLDYVPLEIISITLDGVPETFGVKSELWDTGDDLTLDWYYQPIGQADWFSNNIWRGPQQAAVGGGVVIEVTYRAQTGSYVRSDNTAAQATKRATMGFGSGIYEKILEVKDIPTTEAAQEYADAMVEKLASVPTVVRYTTFRHGLRPGITQTITLSKHGINGEYNVSSVRFREIASSYGGSQIGVEYTIEATSASRAVPHPGRFMEDMVDAIRGAQEAASLASGNGPGTASGGGGIPVWEVPRGLQDGTNTTFLSSYLPEAIPPNGWYYVAMSGGRIMGEGTGDFTADAATGTIEYTSGSQPKAGEDHLILYWRKGGGDISNPSTGARLFAGSTDKIEYPYNANYVITGDCSLAFWVKFSSDTPDYGVIMMYGQNSIAQDANHPWAAVVRGSSDNWGVSWFHEAGTGSVLGVNEIFVDFDLGLENDKWYFIGMARDISEQTVDIWVGDGDKGLITDTGTFTVNPDGGGSLSNTATIGNLQSGTSTIAVPFEGAIQEHYVWSRYVALSEWLNIMKGGIPTSGLELSVRILGNSPEEDESSNAASGTVTGTTVIVGHI